MPRRLASVFNLTGSEIAFLVLIGLIVLGPEKLPDAVRKFTKAYNEFKKMATGFQGEVKQAFDEPMRELRGTADAVRKAADFDISLDGKKTTSATKTTTGKPAEPVRRDGGLNFGNANAKRQERLARDTSNPDETNGESSSGEADVSTPDEVAKAQDAGE
ncbi:MAG: twin-arginine translocase TatA/TatE family subunit [Ilumatobacteraceae bacterium]